VVAALCRGLVHARRRVLRFDFRGVGGSGGAHGHGTGEQEDLEAAIAAVEAAGTDLTIAGYSFGADVALSVDHPDATGWLVAAPPLAVFPMDQFLASIDPRPVRIIHPAHDQFNPPDRLLSSTAAWAATDVHVIDSTDHFFGGAHQTITTLARELIG
jgi:alpha/beta superfamily hydrolase